MKDEERVTNGEFKVFCSKGAAGLQDLDIWGVTIQVELLLKSEMIRNKGNPEILIHRQLQSGFRRLKRGAEGRFEEREPV